MDVLVVGVDGCKEGWLAAEYDLQRRRFTFKVHPDISTLLTSYSAATSIAIDIPIGLTETFQSRRCDAGARKLIGPRRSSVFPAPDRRLLKLSSYPEACAISRQHCGKGITRQSFAILRKIDEVDTAMSPYLQSRVFEIHPEVCFRVAAGVNLNHAKRKAAGFEERRCILQRIFEGVDIPSRSDTRRYRGAQPDDLLDAAIAAWSAVRHAQGRSERLPESPDTDARGLRMEIIY